MPDVSPDPWFEVRDQWGAACGHSHRSARAAITCLANQVTAAAHWGPTSARYTVWIVNRGVSQRVSVLEPSA